MASDPPSVVYIAHLALITHLTSPPPSAQGASNSGTPSAPELQAALSAITTLSSLATQNRHSAIEDLAAVLRVRVLVGAGLWDLVGDALSFAEKAMQLVFHTGEEKPVKGQGGEKAKQGTAEALMRSYSITAQDVHDSASSQSQSQSNNDPTTTPSPAKEASSVPGPKATDALTLALTSHLLILGVIFHTHAGRARAADTRLAALHTLMDGGALVGGANSDGLVEVRLVFVTLTHTDFTTRSPFRGTIPSFYKPLTHTFYFYSPFLSLLLRNGIRCRAVQRKECLQSAVWCSVGKVVWVKKVPSESMVNFDHFLDLWATQVSDFPVPLWASYGDVTTVEQHAFRIEADLLCELVTVSESNRREELRVSTTCNL